MAETLQSLSERIAIRSLIDVYAHCADRRDAARQMALFADNARFAVLMDGKSAEPDQVITGREGLAPVFDQLTAYDATTHFNGQIGVVLDGDEASVEAYCLAHHVKAVRRQVPFRSTSARIWWLTPSATLVSFPHLAANSFYDAPNDVCGAVDGTSTRSMYRSRTDPSEGMRSSMRSAGPAAR